jgi:predicted DNA-binding transcriptional regulator YafY
MQKGISRQKKSHRGDLTERIVRILLMLTDRPHSQRELREEFGVDGVTIRRLIRELMRHIPIYPKNDGREVIYKFEDWYQFKPPSLTSSEIAALLLAQNSIAAIGSGNFGTPFAQFSRTLLEKLRAALPPSLRDYLNTLSYIFGTSAVPVKDFTPHTETIDQLTRSAMSCRRVRMRYHALHDNKIKDYDYDPYAVYFDPDGATLKTIGLDHKDAKIKPFSIDRIRFLKETGEQFERPPKFNLHDHLIEYCFNGIHGEPMLVRLRAYEVTARIFAERRFHPSQEPIEPLTRTPDGQETITIEMRVARGRGLERFILSWMPYIG